MQQQPKNDLVYLLGILEAIGKIEHYSKDFDNPYGFYTADDQLHFNASLMLIATIGDYARKVSIDMQTKYPEVPWKEMYVTRNRIGRLCLDEPYLRRQKFIPLYKTPLDEEIAWFFGCHS